MIMKTTTLGPSRLSNQKCVEIQITNSHVLYLCLRKDYSVKISRSMCPCAR